MGTRVRIRARPPAATPGTGGADCASRPALWRGTGFGLFWGANSVSLLGDRVTMLALPFAAIALHASALQISVLSTASFLPWLACGVFVGVLVDRSAQYRKIMVWADLGRAMLLLSVPAAAARGVLSYWQLLAVALLSGVLTVFFQAASSALLPNLVGVGRLTDANAKLSASSSVAMTAGPGIAGILVQALGAPYAIVGDALSFLASASLLRQVRSPQPHREARVRRPFWADLRAGVRYVVRHPVQRAFVGQAATSNLGAGMNGAIVVLFAVHELHLAAAQIGTAMAVFGLGGGLASLTANRTTRRLGVGPVIIASCAGAGTGSLLIGLASGRTGLVLATLGIAYFAWGYSLTTYAIIAASFRQTVTPEGMRAQVTSTIYVATSGIVPVGAISGGLLATWLGLRAPILAAGAIMLVSALWMVYSPVARVRTMPQPEGDAVGPGSSALRKAPCRERARARRGRIRHRHRHPHRHLGSTSPARPQMMVIIRRWTPGPPARPSRCSDGLDRLNVREDHAR
jgi:MFS family permease